MCGIIAGFTKKGQQLDPDKMRLMLTMAEDRGQHSTGIYNGTQYFRSTNRAFKALASDKMVELDTDIVIGHTRYATKGKKTIDNAHPFNFDRVIGVHNGTIDNIQDVLDIFGVEEKYDVDSKGLYRLINDFDFKEVLPFLKGKLGLVWRDKESGDIMVYKWDRPLWIGKQDGYTYLGSYPDYIKTIGIEEVTEIPEHTLITIRNGEVAEAEELGDDLKPELADDTKAKREEAAKEKEKEEKGDGKFAFNVPNCTINLSTDTDGVNIVWWLSPVKFGTVILQEELSNTTVRYDLTDETGIKQLKSDFGGQVYDHISKDFEEQIEIREELQEIEQMNAQYTKYSD